MNMTQIAFQYRKLVYMILLILLVFGAVSFFTLPAKEDPSITIRTAKVITDYPGLSAERVEELITKKLERAIRKIPEVEEVLSTSSIGRSTITVEIQDQFFDLDAIWQDLRNKVQEAQAELPEGTRSSVVNDEFGDVAVITLALTGDDYEMALLYDMAKHVRDVLYGVAGTKKIDILGVQDERIFLEMSNAKLAQLGITPDQLLNTLSNQNIIQPGGSIDTGAKTFIVEPSGNFVTINDIGSTLIPIPGQDGEGDEVIPLSDIVTITRTYIDPPNQASYYNGKQAIIFAISLLDNFNVLEFSPRMVETIRTVEATLPVGMELNIATYQAEQVDQTINGVSSSVVQTLVIVLVVVMLFLGLRTGLIVGTIVPFVMLVTLALMNVFDLALERMSLATLIISLGLLVDNGIVIAEDFKRRLEEGQSRDDALRDCGREMAVPLLISSLTTILVFLPLMLADHVAGEYTRSISLIVMIALLTSWVLALCVTPSLCHSFMKVKPLRDGEQKEAQPKDFMSRLYAPYTVFLHWALRNKTVFLSLMLALLIGSGWLMGIVPKQFFPDSDRTQLLVYAELPTNTSARTTDRRMRDIFAFLDDREAFPHILSYSGYVGYGGPRFVLSLSPGDPASNTGFIVLNIDASENMDATLDALRVGFIEQFPDMFIRTTRMFLGPSDASKLEIQVRGPDADVIYSKAKELEALMRQIPGTIDIHNNWENRVTNVIVNVDQQRARRAGVTSRDIANSMQNYFSGVEVTEFRDGDDIIPIVMRAEAAERFNIDRMRTMNVYSSSRDVNVPLFQIADFEPNNEFAKIQRENMFRTVTVEGKNLLQTAEDLKAGLDPYVQKLAEDLPPGHWIEYDGVIAESAGAQEALSASIPLVIGVILILLVAQFNSYRKPLIIVLTIPLVLIGAAVGLFVMGSPFGFMVTLGLYSLAGIIINNAIVLIDRIDIELADGNSPYNAVINACVMRLRPIVMTTITTILGLMPLIVSQDALFYGMANAMAFGLGVGTVLTLGVVPVLYAVFYRVRKGA
ncbi:efflux RND transporter permease subunit [Kiloniella sp. b19]|uniref:efflux RND transporter permease subunit n=1 Tax=Kiloniella sp. GXU_MW_B19 TaxID=3141326 RepID=UPI0031CF7CE3